MSQADQLPFPLHLRQASQEEIAKPQTRFDLAEHRFDDHLAASLFGAPFLCPVPPRHLLLRCQVLRWSTFRRIRHFVVVLLTTRRDEHIFDPFIRIQSLHVLFAEVTRVGGERSDVFRNTRFTRMVNRLIRHGHGLTNIVRLIGDVGRDENLLLVRHRLSVPALIEPLVRSLHDLRFGVREIAVGLRIGDPLVRVGAMPAAFRLHLVDMVLSLLTSRLFQSFLRRENLRQSAFATFQFVRNFVASQIAELIVISRIRIIGLSQQSVDFLL